MDDMHWLKESLKTISNLSTTAQILIALDCPELLPTILELMKIELDNIVDEHCVKRGGR